MSEPFSYLCEGQPLDEWSGQASHSSVRNNYDFSTVSSRNGPNSFSRPPKPHADSYSSPFIPKSVTFPPQSPIPGQLLASESTWQGPQQAAQSVRPTTFSSASACPSTKLPPIQCGRCQVGFKDVQSALKHVTDRHRDTGHSRWPCIAPNCDKDFKYEKDLRRHLENQHLDIRYTCSCGHRARRDKHKSHIRLCQPQGGGFYTCQCGNTTGGLNEHLRHLEKTCQLRGKKGRPPKTSNKSAQRQADGGIPYCGTQQP